MVEDMDIIILPDIGIPFSVCMLPPFTNCSYLVGVLQYPNDPKFSDRYACANSADPDQTAPDKGLHCLPFHLHRLDSLLYGRAT